MALISGAIPNVINGVSQQPPSLRLNTQAQRQVNGVSSVVKGLYKRPPTEHVALLSSFTSNSFIHTVRLLSAENILETYFVIVAPTGIQVINENGEPQTVTADNIEYLTGTTNASEDFGATSVADYTFLVNKKKKVKVGSTRSAPLKQEGMIFVKQGDYSSDYSVTIAFAGTDYTATYSTRNSSDVLHEPDVKTTNIASRLKTALEGAVPEGFTFELLDNIIYVFREDNAVFSLDATDSFGDSHITGIKGVVSDLKSLPAQGKLGFRVRINGDNTKGQDDYFVELQQPEDGSDFVWKECVGFDVLLDFDAETLPHQLIRNGDGTFTFEPVTWTLRNSGDDETNPYPSFANYDATDYPLGRYTINDVFFYKDRLCFLSDENLISSQTGSYFNFFQTTVLTLLDDGVVDIAVTNNTVSILKHGVPFDESIILFSDLAQFKVLNADIFSPATVSASVTTNFEASLRAKPASAGKYVFFPFLRGSWAGLREYFVDSDNDTNDASDITSHVPNFIDGEVTQLLASSNLDMLFATAQSYPDRIYTYSYYWSAGEKLQSAWNYWTIGAPVVHMSVENTTLYLLVERAEGVCLETVNLSVDTAVTGGLTYPVLIDRRIEVTAVDQVLPYTGYVLCTNDGRQVTEAEAVLTASLNAKVYAGFKYNFEYEFSPIVMKANDKPITTGRLQLKRFNLVFSDTGAYNLTVRRKSPNQELNFVEYRASNDLGSSLVTGQSKLETGNFQVGIQSEASNTSILITSTSFLPVVLQSAEWEAVFHIRSRRLD